MPQSASDADELIIVCAGLNTVFLTESAIVSCCHVDMYSGHMFSQYDDNDTAGNLN